MSYYKRIIVDFDDTLSFATNRQWSHSKPNLPLIKKLNQLHSQGWQIDIFTARGSLSCQTRQEASSKYRKDIESWLKKNDVKYHSLSFDKPLGVYYIDDKAITPEKFLNLEIQSLNAGLSGADIYHDGKFVYKTSSNSKEVQVWYKTVEKLIHTPKVRSVIGETITLEYINHDPNYFNNHFYAAIGLVIDGLERLKILNISEKLSYQSYVERIQKKINNLPFSIPKNFMANLNKLKLEQSFAHGDYGITNILFYQNLLYMIDPIPSGVFGCTSIDAGKFCASLYINKYNTKICQTAERMMEQYCQLSSEQMRCLVLAEIIRVYEYHENKTFMKKLILEMLQKGAEK